MIGTLDGGNLQTLDGRSRHAQFVAVLIASTTLYSFLLRSLLTSLQGRIDSTWLSAGILAAGVAIYLPMIWRSGLPMAAYGLTLRHWRRHVGQSLIWTAAFLVGTTLLKIVSLRVVPAWQAEPLFSMYGFTRYGSLAEALGLIAIYSLFVPVQELIARGAMQSSLRRLFVGRHRATWSIVLSTLMFSQIHLHLNAAYAIGVLIPSLFWGAMYERQRSLVGVTVSHLVIGIYVAFFLGFPALEHAI